MLIFLTPVNHFLSFASVYKGFFAIPEPQIFYPVINDIHISYSKSQPQAKVTTNIS